MRQSASVLALQSLFEETAGQKLEFARAIALVAEILERRKAGELEAGASLARVNGWEVTFVAATGPEIPPNTLSLSSLDPALHDCLVQVRQGQGSNARAAALKTRLLKFSQQMPRRWSKYPQTRFLWTIVNNEWGPEIKKGNVRVRMYRSDSVSYFYIVEHDIVLATEDGKKLLFPDITPADLARMDSSPDWDWIEAFFRNKPGYLYTLYREARADPYEKFLVVGTCYAWLGEHVDVSAVKKDGLVTALYNIARRGETGFSSAREVLKIYEGFLGREINSLSPPLQQKFLTAAYQIAWSGRHETLLDTIKVYEHYGFDAKRLRDDDLAARWLTATYAVTKNAKHASLRKTAGIYEHYGFDAKRLRDDEVAKNWFTATYQVASAGNHASLRKTAAIYEQYGFSKQRLYDDEVAKNWLSSTYQIARADNHESLDETAGIYEEYGFNAERLRDDELAEQWLAATRIISRKSNHALLRVTAMIYQRHGLSLELLGNNKIGHRWLVATYEVSKDDHYRTLEDVLVRYTDRKIITPQMLSQDIELASEWLHAIHKCAVVNKTLSDVRNEIIETFIERFQQQGFVWMRRQKKTTRTRYLLLMTRQVLRVLREEGARDKVRALQGQMPLFTLAEADQRPLLLQRGTIRLFLTKSAEEWVQLLAQDNFGPPSLEARYEDEYIGFRQALQDATQESIQAMIAEVDAESVGLVGKAIAADSKRFGMIEEVYTEDFWLADDPDREQYMKTAGTLRFSLSDDIRRGAWGRLFEWYKHFNRYVIPIHYDLAQEKLENAARLWCIYHSVPPFAQKFGRYTRVFLTHVPRIVANKRKTRVPLANELDMARFRTASIASVDHDYHMEVLGITVAIPDVIVGDPENLTGIHERLETIVQYASETVPDLLAELRAQDTISFSDLAFLLDFNGTLARDYSISPVQSDLLTQL